MVSRARHGARSGSSRGEPLDTLPVTTQSSYPAGLPPRTLGLLGKVDALLKAEPRPPRWALLRVLSLLEEDKERSSS